MPTAKIPTTTSVHFSPAEIEAAESAALTVSPRKSRIDWSKATITSGGGVAVTVTELRRTRGPSKGPAKEQVAIRLDQEVVGALRASGSGWQTRVNALLKEWLATQPAKPKARGRGAV